MAEDLTGPKAPEPPEKRRVYRFRFGAAYIALAVVAGIGIGSSVMLIDRPAKEPELSWSSWQPAGSESTFDDQIADFVASSYRLPSNSPLVAVIPGPPAISVGEAELTIRSVVIEDDPEGDRDGFRVVDVADSRMYQLCGSGAQCSIGGATPSAEQLRLVRREALELALYTFKYIDGTDTVITLLPPNRGDTDNPDDDEAVALFFERTAVRDELKQPLSRTLLSPNPPQAAELDPRESLIIDRLTESRLFIYQFQASLAGGAIMRLVRPTGVQ